MSNLPTLLALAPGVSNRLREARMRLGLKQVELATFGEISRATQVSYEAGVTEPTTKYLRGIQPTGIDIPFILFGHDKAELESIGNPFGCVDWSVMRQAHESVDFFCIRIAPQCPPRYRWKLIAHLYRKCLERTANSTAPISDNETNQILSEAWKLLGQDLPVR